MTGDHIPKFVFKDDTANASLTYSEIVSTAIPAVGIKPALTAEALLDLKVNFAAQFHLYFPDDYQIFLRQMNGFQYQDVVTFFGVNRHPEQDLLTANLERRLDFSKQMEQRILIGESHSYLFAYNQGAPNGKRYERLYHNFAIDRTFADLGILLQEIVQLSDVLGMDTSFGLRHPKFFIQ